MIRGPRQRIGVGHGHSAAADGIGISIGLNNSFLYDADRATLWGWGGGTGVDRIEAHSSVCTGLRRSAGCAIRSTDGAIVCWGNDVRSGVSGCRERPYIPFPEFAGIVKVQLQEDYGCVLLGAGANLARLGADGALYCWGNNDFGQLGVPGDGASPRQVVFGGL